MTDKNKNRRYQVTINKLSDSTYKFTFNISPVSEAYKL